MFPAAAISPLATMFLPTAKGTPKIFSAGIAGVGKEADPTVAARDGALHQVRTGPQEAIQRALVLTNDRLDAVVLVPILAEREKFRDGYNKTARVSVIMSVLLCISSSYSLGAEASRGRARIFYGTVRESGQRDRATDPSRTCGPHLQVVAASPLLVDFPARLPGKELLPGKEAVALIPSFQVVGQSI